MASREDLRRRNVGCILVDELILEAVNCAMAAVNWVMVMVGFGVVAVGMVGLRVLDEVMKGSSKLSRIAGELDRVEVLESKSLP